MNGNDAGRRAQALVRVRSRQPGGPWFVELTRASAPPVPIGPYENPAIAREQAQHIRDYLAALLGRQTPKPQDER
jgi:hypothetical protein